MAKRDDLKEEIKEDEKNSSGEAGLGGSATDLEADDNTKEALDEIEGHELLTGEEDSEE